MKSQLDRLVSTFSAVLLSFFLVSIQEAIRADEQRTKMKRKDRKELEAAEERERRVAEQNLLISTGEQNAASTVRLKSFNDRGE